MGDPPNYEALPIEVKTATEDTRCAPLRCVGCRVAPAESSSNYCRECWARAFPEHAGRYTTERDGTRMGETR